MLFHSITFSLLHTGIIPQHPWKLEIAHSVTLSAVHIMLILATECLQGIKPQHPWILEIAHSITMSALHTMLILAMECLQGNKTTASLEARNRSQYHSFCYPYDVHSSRGMFPLGLYHSIPGG